MAEILVLDDVYDLGILIKKILNRKSHTVHSFTEKEAIAIIGKNKIAGETSYHAFRLSCLGNRGVAISLGTNEHYIKPMIKKNLKKKSANFSKTDRSCNLKSISVSIINQKGEI